MFVLEISPIDSIIYFLFREVTKLNLIKEARMDFVLEVASDGDESANEIHGGCFYLVQFNDKLVPEEKACVKNEKNLKNHMNI